MLTEPESTDAAEWHRYFAMKNNNRAWTLAALPKRSRAENREMLSAAHAASVHWRQVGTPLNMSRADMLLTAVHSLLGHGALAWALAVEMKAAFDTPETPAWEAAFVHIFHAHAAAVSGRKDEHAASYALAKAAVEEMSERLDREIALASFVQVPVP